jgi:hypothetical protein
MVNLYIPEQSDDPGLRANYFNYTTAGTLDVLGQTFMETIYYNPLSAVGRMNELYQYGDSGRKLSREQYRESQYFREGIEVDEEGIYEGAASILASRHDEREARRLVLDRSKGGFAIGAAQFGVGLVASMLDPINVGSAFVPVVNTARFASLAARYGKNSARALTGAVEGAVGAALVEPIVLTAAAVEQDKDYNLYDSFMNVAFGTALGGGLHVIGGKLSDAVSATKQDTREILTRTAVGQLASGKNVNVEPIAQADATLRSRGVPLSDVEPDTVGPAAGEAREPKFPATGRGLPESLKPLGKKPKSLLQFIKEAGGISTTDKNAGDVRALLDKAGFQIFRKNGKSLDELAEMAQEAGYINPNLDTYQARATINDLLAGIEADTVSGRKLYSQIDSYVDDYKTAEALYDEAQQLGVDPTGMDEATFQEAMAEARTRKEQAEFAKAVEMDGLTEEEFYRLREREQQDVQDYPELNEFRQKMEDARKDAEEFDGDELEILNKENELLQSDISFLSEQGLVPDEFIRDIAAADELTAKAEGYDSATRAAADCVHRSIT